MFEPKIPYYFFHIGNGGNGRNVGSESDIPLLIWPNVVMGYISMDGLFPEDGPFRIQLNMIPPPPPLPSKMTATLLVAIDTTTRTPHCQVGWSSINTTGINFHPT